MKLRHFLNRVEHDRVHRAIQAAEQGTSGRIVVYVSHRHVADAVVEAHHLFLKLKLEPEEANTGLLIFLAPKSRQFAVVGGTALHEKLGQPWWDHLAAIIGGHFKADRYTEGLLSAIEEAGRTLQARFPGSRRHGDGESEIIEH